MSTSGTSAPPNGRCATADVDLEALARGYDHRPLSDAAATRAAAAVEGLPPGDLTVDIGGGRGHHADVWAGLGYRAAVVDPSRSMTAAAGSLGSVAVVRGRAEELPFKDEVAVLTYFHLSIHYGAWRRSLDEALRVVKPGGRCVVWTLGARHHRASMLAWWFPSVAEIDIARFPDPGAVARHLAGAGARVRTGHTREIVRRSAGDWLAAVRAGFVSTLQLIDERELRSGIAGFQAAHPDPDATVQYEMLWDRIVAERPD